MTKPIDTGLMRLRDILQAIQDAENFSKSGFGDRQALFATAYSIAIIGEAANHVSNELTKKHADVAWRQIIGMRHRIIHDYGKINTVRLQEVVRTYLLKLKLQIQAILESL